MYINLQRYIPVTHNTLFSLIIYYKIICLICIMTHDTILNEKIGETFTNSILFDTILYIRFVENLFMYINMYTYL